VKYAVWERVMFIGGAAAIVQVTNTCKTFAAKMVDAFATRFVPDSSFPSSWAGSVEDVFI